VLSTLHTNDAPSTITRIIDMGIDPFNIASATLLCSAQRLLRKICPACKKETAPLPHDRYLEAGFTEEESLKLVKGEIKLMAAEGCAQCVNGYKGRFGVLETMPLTEDVKRVIVAGGSSLDIKNKAMEEGMISLRRVALLGAMEGKTSLEEVVGSTLADKSKAQSVAAKRASEAKEKADAQAAEPA
jgi:type IV pilus assembly protein PilB